MMRLLRALVCSILSLALSACVAQKVVPTPADTAPAVDQIPHGIKPLTLEQEEQIAQ
ncbi:hypothetical protein [Pseudaminobacter sp. NGMCC 1.201702]|uniref:hypothetical protein n=1 Tax=Pseudaminobacter sp. NGMCC 1.201702 TaxID=3391825 RepID=UPI0039EF9987